MFVYGCIMCAVFLSCVWVFSSVCIVVLVWFRVVVFCVVRDVLKLCIWLRALCLICL